MGSGTQNSAYIVLPFHPSQSVSLSSEFRHPLAGMLTEKRENGVLEAVFAHLGAKGCVEIILSFTRALPHFIPIHLGIFELVIVRSWIPN